MCYIVMVLLVDFKVISLKDGGKVNVFMLKGSMLKQETDLHAMIINESFFVATYNMNNPTVCYLMLLHVYQYFFILSELQMMTFNEPTLTDVVSTPQTCQLCLLRNTCSVQLSTQPVRQIMCNRC